MAKSRILIVDDNSDVRRLYALALNQRGFEVKLAANGAEAIERITVEKLDLILLDWVMPLMDGGEVLQRLTAVNGSVIPIIVMSGHPPPGDGIDNLGICCWLTKPIGIDELILEIERTQPREALSSLLPAHRPALPLS